MVSEFREEEDTSMVSEFREEEDASMVSELIVSASLPIPESSMNRSQWLEDTVLLPTSPALSCGLVWGLVVRVELRWMAGQL